MSKPIRVVQWSTGVVGRPALKAIVAHPLLELVGCWCHSPDKDGQDAGTLCGLPPLGIRATRDIDALLATKPDVVCYMPQFPKIDEMVKILESGWTVVAPAEIVLGDALPTRARFEVQGWAQEPYFVLVHGLKSRPKVETTHTASGPLQEDRFEASTGTLILHLQGKASVTLDTSGE